MVSLLKSPVLHPGQRVELHNRTGSVVRQHGPKTMVRWDDACLGMHIDTVNLNPWCDGIGIPDNLSPLSTAFSHPIIYRPRFVEIEPGTHEAIPGGYAFSLAGRETEW